MWLQPPFFSMQIWHFGHCKKFLRCIEHFFVMLYSYSTSNVRDTHIFGMSTNVIRRLGIIRAFRQPLFNCTAIGRCMIIHTTSEAGITTVFSLLWHKTFDIYNMHPRLFTRIQFYTMNTWLSLLVVPSSAKLFGNLDRGKIVVVDETWRNHRRQTADTFLSC